MSLPGRKPICTYRLVRLRAAGQCLPSMDQTYLLAATTTLVPRRVSALAISAPIPREAPVLQSEQTHPCMDFART